MVSLKEFFSQHEDDMLKGISQKNNLIKRSIIAYMAVNGQATLAELTKELHISIPTITKLVTELVNEKIVVDNGKIETAGGRRPNTYGLADAAIYFVGVDIARDSLHFVVTDLKNNILLEETEDDFELTDDDKSLNHILSSIQKFLSRCGVDQEKILGMGVCITGRVNPNTGRSYKYFTATEEPLVSILEKQTGLEVLLENDTRARCYAEYFSGNVKDEKNLLYLHLGRGVAIGLVMDGKLYYGKSGFAGEFGHTPFYDNEIICACGKKGCLETEISGIAIESKMTARIEEGVNTVLRKQYEEGRQIHIDDIIAAAKNDDTLSIEMIEEAGEKIGKSIAFLINIFNPELVIIGGNLSQAGDYIMLPLKAATNKFSLNLVYKDTRFRLSQMGEMTGALGAAMLIRNKIIGL